MKFITVTLLLVLSWGLSSAAHAEAGKAKKTQTVDFTGDTVDGNARSPDATYITQKKTVDFLPIYKVREHFDENIKQSVDYLK